MFFAIGRIHVYAIIQYNELSNVEEVLDQGISSHHGIPALDYHFKQAGKEIKGKFIIAGNTL